MNNYSIYPKQYRNARIPVEKNRCFILMPFERELNIVYGHIKETLTNEGFICNRADDISGGTPIISKILNEIMRAQYIIADITNCNPNVFYELGISHCFKDAGNVIMLKRKGSKSPFDINHLTYIEYNQENLILLTSNILKTINDNRNITNFHETLNVNNIISYIGDNTEVYVELVQTSLCKHLDTMCNILNKNKEELDINDVNTLFSDYNILLNSIIRGNEIECIQGVLKIYIALLLECPYPELTDKLVQEFLGSYFDVFSNVARHNIISWKTDLALSFAEKGLKTNLVLPWIINYFTQTKSTTIDLNRYKLERFLLLSDNPVVNQSISNAILSENCYIREHLSDIIGEKRLIIAKSNIITKLRNEENFYSASSMMEALGKLGQCDESLNAIIDWIEKNGSNAVKTKQLFVLKHARIAIDKLDSTADKKILNEFDLKYRRKLQNYYIL